MPNSAQLIPRPIDCRDTFPSLSYVGTTMSEHAAKVLHVSHHIAGRPLVLRKLVSYTSARCRGDTLGLRAVLLTLLGFAALVEALGV